MSNSIENARTMFLIRAVELGLLRLYERGLISGTIHTCVGQEACAVGVVSRLTRDLDYVLSNHRGHGHYIALTGDVRGLVAEVLGREDGVVGGLGGSQHIHRDKFFASGVQGGLVGVANGLALSIQRRNTGGIAAVFLGDGTFGQGLVFEAMNIAALWRLPVLYVVESNGYSQSTPTAAQHAGRLDTRAQTFGIETSVVDGNELGSVEIAAEAAVTAIRNDAGPRLLYLETYRLGPHSKGDDYRDREEVQAHERRDPLVRISSQIGEQQASLLQQEAEREFAGVLKELGIQ